MMASTGRAVLSQAECSNSKRDDNVSEEIQDMLDLEADPPSDDRNDIRLSDPELEPKHQVFLSHSGKQNDFTELLCRMLESWGYSPFFDIRQESLPKGKKFPELIFRAARQCRVAVLILSEEYFTTTKWPMLELEAFVDAQEKNRKENRPAVDILPVYLGLRREDCRKYENVERWQKRWEEMENLEMAEKMKEMDEVGRAEMQAQRKAARGRGELRSQKWKDAMKVLGPSNGIEYEQSFRQAGLIDRVVSAVRCLLPPSNMASDPSTQARGRICKAFISMISKTSASRNGARVVGVYGMGGMGKTTFCKELCCELYKSFEGKVCHAELGRVSASALQKEVVQKLTDVNWKSLSFASESKVSEDLRMRMAGEKVFLALDNVWPESKREAMVYIQQARYGMDSILIVTARSIDILLSLRLKRSDCFAMPELEEEDAKRLFLHHAAPDFQSRGEEDEECIRLCVFQCHFLRGGEGGGHFLPLALKVLGEKLCGMEEDPRIWVKSLSKEDNFDVDRKREHPIFYILGRGYDSLRAEDQLLFMDVVLCKPDWNPRVDEYAEWWTFFEWLSIVHYGTASKESSIRDRLQGLKARALLEDIGDGRRGVYVHDLYREFAQFEASRGDLDVRRVVWHKSFSVLPTDLLKTPSGNCWCHVERLGIKCEWLNSFGPEIAVDGVKWQHFANVVVLELQIYADDQVLDLRGLRCLRSLVLDAWGSRVIGLGELRNLEWLYLNGIHCEPCLGDIGRLSKLQMLRLKTYCAAHNRSCAPRSRFPNFHKCISLRSLVVVCGCFQALPDLGGLRFLREVEFQCKTATEGPRGLGSCLHELQELRLRYCSSLDHTSLPQLHEVVSLQVLKFECLKELVVLPDIGTLTRLRILELSSLANLVEVPALGELVALEELYFDNLRKLTGLPNMRLLTKLQQISLYAVPGVWVQRQLLGMVPSQLRYFLPRGSVTWRSKLVSEERLDRNVVPLIQVSKELLKTNLVALDLHEWYMHPNAAVLHEIHPALPSWWKAQVL